MSMTKRYLESLPIEEQNAILGTPEDDYEVADETWTPNTPETDAEALDIFNATLDAWPF